MTNAITVLIIDDNQLARMGVAMLLSTQDDVKLVGEAADGPSGLKLYQEVKPNVALVDLRLPNMDGVAVLEAIRRLDPHARCLVLSHYEGDENIFRALKAGAGGYLTKQASGPEILNAIRAVFAGKRYLPPEIASQLADRFGQSELTKREQEVLVQVSEGKSNRAIADLLQISDRTVATYVSAIMAKLQAKSRTEAVSRARTRGLIPKD
ncbi:MAG: response regulator transcription factor [Deltaproteobacteria bacterium]|nr:response regulator transcription factor [Deltaproteobacteria bacterium]